MRRTSRCQLFLMLCILAVVSAPAAVAADPLYFAPSEFSPLATQGDFSRLAPRAELAGPSTQATESRPQDIDPARSQIRPLDCTFSNYQHKSATHGAQSHLSCDDAFNQIAAAADGDAQTGCCNLYGAVWYESSVQGTCYYEYPPGLYVAGGYINYTCKFCIPPVC
jgi:hypothetical protein